MLLDLFVDGEILYRCFFGSDLEAFGVPLDIYVLFKVWIEWDLRVFRVLSCFEGN